MALSSFRTAIDKSLSTVVRNISGQTMFFSFLGRHGVKLAANQEYIHFGDLASYLSTIRMGRPRVHYEKALNNGLLLLESTPAVVLFDLTTSRPRQLELSNSILGFSDPLAGPTPNSSFVNA